MKYCFTLFLIFMTPLVMHSQQLFEGHFNYGHIIKHNTEISFDNTKPAIGLSLAYSFQTNGKKPWHVLRKFPQVNINLIYFNLGNKDVLGYGLGIYPSLTLNILEKNKYKLSGRIGWGLGYLSKKYDRKTNPTQNAIGSHLNILPGFSFINTYQLNNKWFLYQSFSLIHFSNASFSKPNLGVNIIALNLGLQYKIKERATYNYVTEQDTTPKRHFYFGVTWGGGMKEIGTSDGPKYTISFTSLYFQYILKKHIINWGIDLERNNAIYAFARHTNQFSTKREAVIASRRKAVFLADEIMYGRFGLWIQWGLYFDKSSSFLLAGNHYFKLGSRYHFYLDKKKHRSAHIGFYMKSHKIIAEYFSLAIGISL